MKPPSSRRAAPAAVIRPSAAARGISRRRVEAAIEMLIAHLDALDGDPDLEDDSQDRCPAGDDTGTGYRAGGHDLLPGDPVDAEEAHLDDPRSPASEMPSQDLADYPPFRDLFWRSA